MINILEVHRDAIQGRGAALVNALAIEALIERLVEKGVLDRHDESAIWQAVAVQLAPQTGAVAEAAKEVLVPRSNISW